MRSTFSLSGRGNEPQRALHFFHLCILNFTFPVLLIYSLPAATYFMYKRHFCGTDTGLVMVDGVNASRHLDLRPLLNAVVEKVSELPQPVSMDGCYSSGCFIKLILTVQHSRITFLSRIKLKLCSKSHSLHLNLQMYNDDNNPNV